MSMFGRRALAPAPAAPAEPREPPPAAVPAPSRPSSAQERRVEALKGTHERIQAALYDRIDATAATKLPRDELNRQILELIAEIVVEQRLSLHGREQELLGATIPNQMRWK